MSKSRSVRRVLAAVAALPLVLTAAPLTGIAEAAVTITATNHPLPSPRFVGPNAGFNDPARGVAGFTPLYRVELSDQAVGLQSVRIGLAGPTLNVYRDFDSTDGFSIFADIDNDGVFDAPCEPLPPATEDGEPIDCPSDFARGPASSGFSVGAASGGVVPVTITGRLVAEPVEEGETPDPTSTGFRSYFVVVHPTALNLPNRVFTPRLFAAGVSTTDGASAPGSALASEPITLDSLAPPLPNAGNFSEPLMRPPMSPTQLLEDSYFVSSAERNSEPGKKLAFFNNGTDTATAGLLRRPDGSLVIHDAPVFTSELRIGDGTGIDAVTKVAKNNQTNSDVWVRSLDAAGNLTASATRLYTDEVDTDNSPGPYKGNDVIAPVYTTARVDFERWVDGSEVFGYQDTQAITAANAAAAEVSVNYDGVPNSTGTRNASSYNISPTHGRVDVRAGVLDGRGLPTGEFTPWQTVPIGGTGSNKWSDNFPIDVTPLSDGRVFAQVRAFDPSGNAAAVHDSECTSPTNPTLCDTLRAIPKDTSVPRIVGWVPASGYADGPHAGDKLKVYFSEPMDTSDIVTRASGNSCGPPDAAPPPADTNDPCVVFRLTPKDGSPSIPETGPAVYDRVTFGGNAQPAGFSATTGEYAQPGNGIEGSGPGFEWTDGGAAAIITLASGGTQPDDGTGFAIRYPQIGDSLKAVTNSVTDKVGNALANAVTLLDAGVIPLTAKTRDTVVNFPGMELPTGQNTDGVLDSIDLVFSDALSRDSVTAAALNFRVTGSTGAFTPTVVVPDANSTTLELRIPLTHALGGSETPVVSLVGDTAAATGLLKATGSIPVPPFSIFSSDTAQPSLRDAKTQDADHDGKIDSVAVRYSELLNHGLMNSRGYVFTGRTNIAGEGVSDDLPPKHRAANTFTPTTGIGASQTVNLTEAAAAVFDTGVLPPGFYSTYRTTQEDQTSPTVGLQDLAFPPNYGGWNMPFVPDGAQPVAVGAVTRDVDSDGKLDAVDVKFSEPLASSSSSNGTFTVEGHNVTGSYAIGADVIQVRFDETGEPFTGNTATLPPVRYTGGLDGGVRDGAGLLAFVPAADAPAIAPTDGAGPAIVTATVNFDGNRPTTDEGGNLSDKMRVFFSEPVAAVAPADFLVKQGTGEPVAPTAAALAADFLTADLTLDPKLDRFADAFVSFGPDAAVKDRVTPTPNANTQRDFVLSPAYPIATLDVVGRPTDSVGWSTLRRPNVIAGGNAGVTGYCLDEWRTSAPVEAEPAARESAEDECFTALPPTTTTRDLIDGTYSFRLVTKDRFGNVSAPATDTLKVDATGPSVSSVSFRNFTTGSTNSVRDNDFVTVSGVGTGAGPSKFTATVDYKNLTPNPGNPSRCGLGGAPRTVCTGQVVSTSSTSRSFSFPFVTASGTTQYPVGTVLRASNATAGQPYILEDGPSGLVRRRFVSTQAMTTYRIPSKLIITVPAAVTNAIPVSAYKPWRDGSLVRVTGTPEVYVISEGRKYHVSAQQFADFGYKRSNVLVVPAKDLAKVPAYVGSPYGTAGIHHPVGTYVRNTSNNLVYAVVRGSQGDLRKRQVTTTTALATLVPSAQVINVAASHPSMLLPTDQYKRGLRDGMLIKFPNDKHIYAISRGALRHIANSTVFNRMGFSLSNVVTVGRTNVATDPSKSTVTTLLASPIGTRFISYTVTVRDEAGNTATRNGSVSALGTPLAKPSLGNNAALP